MEDILAKINNTALKFLEPLNPEDTFKVITNESLNLIDGVHSSIVLEQDGKLKRAYSTSPIIQKVNIRKNGLIEKVFKKPQVLVVQIKSLPWINPIFKSWEIKTITLIPLCLKDKPIGVLTIQSRQNYQFNKKELKALELFGSLASLAIKNAQLGVQTREALEARDSSQSIESTMGKIYKSAVKFLVSLAPQEINKVIVEEVIKLIPAQYASLYIENEKQLTRAHTTLPVSTKLKVRRNGSTYLAFNQKQIIIKKAKDYENNLNMKPVLALDVKTIIFLPLVYRSQSTGVIIINLSKDKDFSEKELEVLKLFSSLASLAIKNTQLYDQTKQAIEARDLFISMAAHELRTPLTTINGYIQLLRNKIPIDDTAESRWIYQLYWESYRMTQLVNELLAMERIKSKKFHYVFKECSLRSIINRVIENFQFIHPECKISFKDLTLNDSDLIIGDFDKLIQVITNLVDNAAKFSSPDTEIVISLRSKAPYLIFEVKDLGKGISKNDLPKVFDRYFKGMDHTKEGIGLGLFIAKSIIGQHHGKINIKSKNNQGTQVVVSLPKLKV